MSEKEKEELNEEDDELEVVELTDENGETLNCYYLGTMDYKGKTYAFFQPVDENDEDGNTIIYEVEGDDTEEATFIPIEDDKLLEEIFDAYLEEYKKTFPEEFN